MDEWVRLTSKETSLPGPSRSEVARQRERLDILSSFSEAGCVNPDWLHRHYFQPHNRQYVGLSSEKGQKN